MASFAEELKKALANVSNDYLAARNDLLEEVVDASKQVEELTQGRVKLTLEKKQEDENGAILSLVMLNDQSAPQEITGFKIGLGGYPILVAPWATLRMGIESLRGMTKIPDKQGISAFMTQLASDRNSPLVRKLAFVLRKK